MNTMERLLIRELDKWKKKKNRRPLLLTGARCTGKTRLMKDFAAKNFTRTVYIDFENDTRLHDLLERTSEPKQIISALSLICKEKITPEDSLIIFDEIREEPGAMEALKHFCDKAPEYTVIAADSYPENMADKGKDVTAGKLDRLTLYPMSFREFLCATGRQTLYEILNSGEPYSICAMKSFFEEELRLYYTVGGMPAVVQEYVDHEDLLRCRKKQEEILDLYRQDIAKHAPASLLPRVYQVWDAIPGQLSEDNRKFIFGHIEKGTRARSYEAAIRWLSDSGLIYRVHRVKQPGASLKTNVIPSSFKLYLHDTGLLGAMGALEPESIIDDGRLFGGLGGAINEQYVVQQLVSDMGIDAYYYSSANSRGEIDLLIRRGDGAVPIEVRAEENLKAKSLRAFMQKYDVKKGVRISLSDYREQDRFVNLPLYAFMALL